MRKHGGTPSWRDNNVTPAAISPPGVARGCFVGGQQSGLAGCKPPPLFTPQSLFLFVTGATPGGTMGRLSTTECTYLPTHIIIIWKVILHVWLLIYLRAVDSSTKL